MTSCGCFECILAMVPECNGFMIVNREYAGMTPCGMNFSTLAGSVGGGNQTPGFLGVGRLYVLSHKFIAADGGLKRLVWMPKELKEFYGDRFKARAQEEGVPDLLGQDRRRDDRHDRRGAARVPDEGRRTPPSRWSRCSKPIARNRDAEGDMALKALDIFKLLPKTNCQKCGSPTCLAFAMKLAQKQATLDKCPDVTAEAKAALEGAAAPPIRLVTIGAGAGTLEIGNETVMFRHEETFYHPPGIGVVVPDDLDEAALAARVAAIDKLQFMRVGAHLQTHVVAVENVSGSMDAFSRGGRGGRGTRPADRPSRDRGGHLCQGPRESAPSSGRSSTRPRRRTGRPWPRWPKETAVPWP